MGRLSCQDCDFEVNLMDPAAHPFKDLLEHQREVHGRRPYDSSLDGPSRPTPSRRSGIFKIIGRKR